MKMHIKLAVALGAAALMMPLADAGAATLRPFAGQASPSSLDVKCTPGNTSARATARFKLSMTEDVAATPLAQRGDFANATSVRASWPGGFATLSRFGRTTTRSSLAKFPCPAPGGTSAMTVTFQPRRSGRNVGSAAKINVNLKWFGPAVIRQFAGVASPGAIVVDCGPTSTSAKSLNPVKLKATHTLNLADSPSMLGDDLNRSTKIVASWPGGKATLTRFERDYTVTSKAKFPCPATTSSLNVSFQPYRGAAKIGLPAQDTIKLVRKGQVLIEETTTIPPGGGTTPDPGPATAENPVTVSVTSPNGGVVTIQESAINTTDPSGFNLLGREFTVSAPPATVANPLVFRFTIEGSVLPAGVTASNLAMLRNGIEVVNCTGPAGQASPDPCIANRSTAGSGDVTLTVNSSHASGWEFAQKLAPPS